VERKIRYTEAAIADLEEIAARSWTEHPETSERFLTGLLNHIDLLSQFPLMGAPLEGLADVRRLLHTPLYVYYRFDVDGERIVLLHIWHRARRRPVFQ
jgi:plasmid stabilization system protein ParE